MKKLILFCKLMVTLALFYWLIQSDKLDLGKLFAIHFGFKTTFFFLLILSHLYVQAIRWKYVVKYYHLSITNLQAVTISWIGNFFSLFLPGASSGEIIRGYYIYKIYPESFVKGVSSLLIDRVLGFLTFAIVSFLSCFYLFVRHEDPHLHYLFIFTFLLVIALILILFVLTSQKSFQYVRKIIPKIILKKISSNIEFSDQPRKDYLIIAMALSVVSTGFAIAGFIFAAEVLGKPLDLYTAFLNAPIIIMSNTLPIAPGGLGVAESVSAMLFSQDGYLHGAEIMFLYRIGISLLRLPGGLIYLLYQNK